MNGLEQFAPLIGNLIGVDGATLVLIGGMLVTFANLTGRLIPDDKVGVLGRIRDLCKIVGFYASNRVTSGVTTNDVVKSIVTKTTEEVLDAASNPGTLIGDAIDEIADKSHLPEGVVQAFPGLAATVLRDAATGKFTKREDGESV